MLTRLNIVIDTNPAFVKAREKGTDVARRHGFKSEERETITTMLFIAKEPLAVLESLY